MDGFGRRSLRAVASGGSSLVGRGTLLVTPEPSAVAYFVVLHHPHDRSPTRWSNEWERGSPNRIRAITTTARIAEDAQAAGRVFVHRCAHGTEPAAVVCEARVLAVTPLESKRGADCLVTFETVRTLNAVPPVFPERGMNSYVAGDP